MTPSPAREHQVACSRLIRLLEPALPDGYAVIGAWASAAAGPNSR
jgi:hypothetical protein